LHRVPGGFAVGGLGRAHSYRRLASRDPPTPRKIPAHTGPFCHLLIDRVSVTTELG